MFSCLPLSVNKNAPYHQKVILPHLNKRHKNASAKKNRHSPAQKATVCVSYKKMNKEKPPTAKVIIRNIVACNYIKSYVHILKTGNSFPDFSVLP